MTKALKLKSGRCYVHILPDGREEFLSKMPSDRPALTVDVDRDRQKIVETTYTFNRDKKLVKPPGRGWRLFGRPSKKNSSSTWRREWSLKPLPRRLEEGDRFFLRVFADGTEWRCPFFSTPDMPPGMFTANWTEVAVTAANSHSIVEQVTTRDWIADHYEMVDFAGVKLQAVCGFSATPVAPPGDGWRIHDASKDYKTVWRRIGPQAEFMGSPVQDGPNVIRFRGQRK